MPLTNEYIITARVGDKVIESVGVIFTQGDEIDLFRILGLGVYPHRIQVNIARAPVADVQDGPNIVIGGES